MSDSATGASVAAAFGWKAAGGVAGVALGGAGLALLVVTCMTPPRNVREWTVGLVSTVLGSICGGAAVVQHYDLQAWLNGYVGLVAVLGLAFLCGLPAWAVVRLLFNAIEKRKDKDLLEVVDEVRGSLRGKP